MILAYDAFKLHTFADAFRFMADNPGLMWQKTAEHLQISGEAMAIALVIAIPLGVWLGHLHRGSFIAINLSNIGRALPSLAVIAIGLGIFGIGKTNVVFALVVLAFPLMLTNAYVAVDGVDRAAIEALRAEQLALADAASKRFAQALGDTAEVLTPEQRRKIDDRLTELRERRGFWHGWRRG